MMHRNYIGTTVVKHIVVLPIIESNSHILVVRKIIFQAQRGDTGHWLVTDKKKTSLGLISVA